MGNCVSASRVIAPEIRVVQASEGRVVDVELPPLQSSMTVGELMLEFPPAHFVAQLNKPDLLASTGKRATPLGADADAKPGAVYVLFPMPRLHTRITPQELLSFAKLLHLQEDQQLTKATHNPFKAHVKHGLFSARARVAPLIEEECKDVQLHSGADAKEQACQLPISFRKQQSEQESVSDADLSISCISSSCGHGQMGVIKPKPWAPKLQTIMESHDPPLHAHAGPHFQQHMRRWLGRQVVRSQVRRQWSGSLSWRITSP